MLDLETEKSHHSYFLSSHWLCMAWWVCVVRVPALWGGGCSRWLGHREPDYMGSQLIPKRGCCYRRSKIHPWLVISSEWTPAILNTSVQDPHWKPNQSRAAAPALSASRTVTYTASLLCKHPALVQRHHNRKWTPIPPQVQVQASSIPGPSTPQTKNFKSLWKCLHKILTAF